MLSRKFQAGGATEPIEDLVSKYIFDSERELQESMAVKSTPTRNAKGNTICLGACLNFNEKRGKKLREMLYSTKGYERIIGDTDNVIDSWNMLSAAYNNDNFEVLYDRYRDGELTPEKLENLPAHALIGTGDARGHFGISKDNPQIVSRHTITVGGFRSKDGKPLIYDMGRVTAGVPSKYDGNINFIVAPKDKPVYFKDINPYKSLEQPVMASTTDGKTLTAPPVPVEKEDYEVPVLEQSNVAQLYAEMLNRSRYQRKQLQQRKQQEMMS